MNKLSLHGINGTSIYSVNEQVERWQMLAKHSRNIVAEYNLKSMTENQAREFK